MLPPDFKTLAKQGEIFTHEHDKNLLSLLHTADLIDNNSQAIQPHNTISDLQNFIKNGNKSIFAVLDDTNHLKGVLTLDDIRPILFIKELDEIHSVQQLMKAPVSILHPWQSLTEIIKIFDDTGVWQLPVIDENNRFIGFISKSMILASYRQLLKEYSNG